MEPYPYNTDFASKSDKDDPRFRARITSKPFHKYRFIKIVGNGQCDVDILDQILSYGFNDVDPNVQTYILTTRDLAKDAIIEIIGKDEFSNLLSGTLQGQVNKMIVLLQLNNRVQNVFRIAGAQRQSTNPLLLEEVKHELDHEELVKALTPTYHNPPSKRKTIILLNKHHLDIYSYLLQTIEQRLYHLSKKNRFKVVQHRLLTIEHIQDAFYHLSIEVVVYRMGKPYGFHFRLKCICRGRDNVEISDCKAVGQVMSDNIIIKTSDQGETIDWSWYIYGNI
jgi:hypothetical protein